MADKGKRITIQDVAEALGVSKTTVSRAISGKGRVGEETRQKILEFIDVNNYQPNVYAKGLAQQMTYNIAVILPSDVNMEEMPFFQNCLYGACRKAAEKEYDVLTLYSEGHDTHNLLRTINNKKIDGAIVSRTVVDDETIKVLRASGLPFVTIGMTEEGDVTRIDHDHMSACRELTAHLLTITQGKMALIGGNNTHMVTRSRYKGYSEAFREAGRTLDKEYVFLNVEDGSAIDEITKQLVADEVETIVCMDDMICSRVIQELEKNKVPIPGMVKVASFYNSTLLERHVPAVTALDFDVKSLGEKASEILIEKINDAEVEQVTLLPYAIKLEETT